MTEPQRSLAGYKSKIHEGTDFENPNEGKTPLTEFDEYVFRLNAFPRVKTMQQMKKGKDGVDKPIDVDKAICEFQEESTENIVLAFFRVDSLNFSPEESYESAVIRFFRKIGSPLVDGIEPNWEEKFLVGMRFRGRVQIGKGVDKKPNATYYLDVPTCRPILASDKYQSNAPANAPQHDSVGVSSATLANAYLICRGAKNSAEAAFKLAEARAPVEITNAFATADRNGVVKYPIL
jgi:hypothetical protein